MDTEVDLESYQTALEEVLSWLLSAEDSLQAQGDISTDVEEVKEQFHTHEVWVNNADWEPSTNAPPSANCCSSVWVVH